MSLLGWAFHDILLYRQRHQTFPSQGVWLAVVPPSPYKQHQMAYAGTSIQGAGHLALKHTCSHCRTGQWSWDMVLAEDSREVLSHP